MKKETETFRITVRPLAGQTDAFMATMVRGGIVVYECVRSGDANRAYNACFFGAGYVDHHGRYFRRISEGSHETIEGIEAQSD